MRYRYLLCFVLTCLFISCFDDKGNYDYMDINEVKISGIDQSKYYEQIAFLDTLKLYPEIEGSLYGSNEDKYQYEWKIIPLHADKDDEVDPSSYVVGKEKNLEYPIELAAGNYNCSFIVLDTESNIRWHQFFYLQVKTLTSEGWMVLCDKNGEARLDIIFNVNEQDDLIAHDLWKDSEFKTGKPYNLIFTYCVNGSGRLFICENGTYNLDVTDLHVGEENSLRWVFGTSPERVDVRGSGLSQFYDKMRYWVVVDKDGDVYSNNTADVGSVFGYPINMIDGKTEFEAAPFVGVTYAQYYGASILLYDNTHKQFLELRDGSVYPSVMKFIGENKLFNAQTGRDMVHLESTKTGYNYAILRDPQSQKYYFYGMIMNEKGKNSQEYHGEIIGDGLENVQQFACHHMHPYVFYVSNNKVYQFDMAHPRNKAKEVLSFPGETIRLIKFNPFVAWAGYQNWERARGFNLVVATNVDGEDEDHCGVVRMYDVPELLGDLVKIKEYTGFGRIVDVAYREKGK